MGFWGFFWGGVGGRGGGVNKSNNARFFMMAPGMWYQMLHVTHRSAHSTLHFNVNVIITLLLAKNHSDNILTRTIIAQYTE